MKSITLLIATIFLIVLIVPSILFAEEVYILKNILTTENPDQAPPTVKLEENGGIIVYEVVYNSTCKGTHQMDWEFSMDITKLSDGDQFTVSIECVNCQGVCGFKWGTDAGTASGANNITSIEGVDDYVYNGNFELTDSTGAVHTYNDAEHFQQFTFKVINKKTVKDTAFYLNLGSNIITYHYAFESASEITSTDGGYEEGYLAGKQFCIDHPEECGISSAGGFTQADLDQKYNEGKDDGYTEGFTACQQNLTDSDTALDGGSCATLSDNLDISLPCIDVFGTKIPIYLEKYTNKEDAFGFYWELILP